MSTWVVTDEDDAALAMMSYVYAISDHIATKVGYAADPMRRLAELQTGNPHTLVLLWCRWTYGAPRIEAEMHRLLMDSRMRGEWFSTSIQEIEDAYRTATQEDSAREWDIECRLREAISDEVDAWPSHAEGRHPLRSR